MQMQIHSAYPKNILKIAETQINSDCINVIAIIPIVHRGFIAVINDDAGTYYKPFIQEGTWGKDFIKLNKSIHGFLNYDETLIALITFKNLGECGLSKTYIDIFCNKMGVTTHSNSISPFY